MNADIPARVRPNEIARITSLSVRKVQEMAAAGQIPGAAKLGGAWTFDLAKVLAWINQREKDAAKLPVNPAAFDPRPGRLIGKSDIEAQYERLVSGKGRQTKPKAKARRRR